MCLGELTKTILHTVLAIETHSLFMTSNNNVPGIPVDQGAFMRYKKMCLEVLTKT